MKNIHTFKIQDNTLLELLLQVLGVLIKKNEYLYYMIRFLFLFFITLQISCNQPSKQNINAVVNTKTLVKVDSVKTLDQALIKPKDTINVSLNLYSEQEIASFKNETFVELKKLDSTFSYNMKYATPDNFLKETVYECDACLVRYETAKQLILANEEFKKLGYHIQFFDCYRPLDIQKKMWKIFPDKRYVANPIKGSNHNRGTAVDITLVDANENPLPMGTKFDFFGRKAHHAYQHLPKEVLANRMLLKKILIKNGFWAITSEWWHYNLNNSKRYAVSNFKTICE